MVFQMILLLGSINAFVHAASLAKGSCQEYCGNVSIPYPFGIGSQCYLDGWFAISCDNSSNYHKPFLRRFDLEVLHISLSVGRVSVNFPVSRDCTKGTNTNKIVDLRKSPFLFSQTKNRFIAMGCNIFGSISPQNDSVIAGCMSFCEKKSKTSVRSCNGIECCQTTIPSDLDVFAATIASVNIESRSTDDCKYAFLVDQRWFETNLTDPFEVQSMSHVPVVLEWGINTTFLSLLMGNISDDDASTYRCTNRSTSMGNLSLTTFTCKCKSGFEGNPYLPQRCTGKLLTVY